MKRVSTKPGKIIVLSASSGAGKTTLVNALCAYFKNKYPISRVVTYTTRAARAGEVEGVDYCFLSPEQFEQKIQEGFFIEWSSAYGAYYGSPRCLIDDTMLGMSFLLILDRAGVKQLLSAYKDKVVPIWIYTSPENLASRLQKRGTETQKEYSFRLSLAQEEARAEKKDPLFAYHVQNDRLDESVNVLVQIITKELEII
jgi:guanylate kinase